MKHVLKRGEETVAEVVAKHNELAAKIDVRVYSMLLLNSHAEARDIIDDFHAINELPSTFRDGDGSKTTNELAASLMARAANAYDLEYKTE